MARDDFERLYREHAEALLGFLSYRTGDRMAAEDIAADTFERALRGRAKFDPRRGNERAWLYKIATNRAIDRERRARRIVANVDDLGLAAPDRHDVALADLARAIGALPAGQRAAFVLRKVQGLGYGEIALALECSEEAARARVSDALKKVKAAVA